MSTVTTQAELDAALAAGEGTVYIQAPEGVWITLRDSGSSHVQGITVEDGFAVVYKAVNDRLESGYGCPYPIGETVKVAAKEWKANGACGNGLHFGPTPRHARSYNADATRFLACRIPVEHASGIPGGTAKIKARSCVVLHEVDIDGTPVGSSSDVAAAG